MFGATTGARTEKAQSSTPCLDTELCNPGCSTPALVLEQWRAEVRLHYRTLNFEIPFVRLPRWCTNIGGRRFESRPQHLTWRFKLCVIRNRSVQRAMKIRTWAPAKRGCINPLMITSQTKNFKNSYRILRTTPPSTLSAAPFVAADKGLHT